MERAVRMVVQTSERGAIRRVAERPGINPETLRGWVRHAERGPESYELLFRMIAGHDRNHLAQARPALTAG
ncbi:MAG: transposase [Actinomycetota bacterium]